MSGIISIITDFGERDGWVGTMKGVILRINPNAKIVDISHQVTPGDILEASLILQASFPFFPQGTIHLCVVDPGVGSKRRAIVVATPRYTFVGPDNGLFTPIYQRENYQALEITNQDLFYSPLPSQTFHGRDIFAPVAAHLSLGLAVEKVGPQTEDLVMVEFPSPLVSSREIKGEVIHIDRFGNLTTNITKELFEKNVQNNPFELRIGKRVLKSLSLSYADGPKGELLAIWGSWGYLELSVNQGSAQKLLSATKGTKLTIMY